MDAFAPQPSFGAHVLRAAAVAIVVACAPLASLRAQVSRAADSGATRTLTLSEAIEIGQRQGLTAAASRDTRDAARWRDRAFTARLFPQLSLNGSVVNLDRSIRPVVQPTGETQFLRLGQNQPSLGLTLSQRLPWLGGMLSVGSQVSRYDPLGADVQIPRNYTASPFVVTLQQDVLRPRTAEWDRKQASLSADIAERQYLEAREDFATAITTAYFDFYAAIVAYTNATANAAVNDTLYTLNKGRYEVGKIGENDLLQSELALLRARASVDGTKLERDRTESALKRLISLPPTKAIDLAPPQETPTIEVDPEVAVKQALENGSTMDLVELDAVTAKRRMAEARFNNGFGASVSASYGVNQTAPELGLAYQSPLPKQQVQVGVSMPMFQWGGGRADVQAAKAEQSRATNNGRARREALEEDARYAALQLTQSQRMLLISAKADTVAQKRFDVAKNRYVIGKIGISDLYIAQNEKDQALTAYVQALRGYWNAYARLRRVTLYDFAEKREVGDK